MTTNYSGYVQGLLLTAASSNPSTFYLVLPVSSTTTALAGDISISQDTSDITIDTMCVTTFFFYINNINFTTGLADYGYAYDCRYNFAQTIAAFPQSSNNTIALYIYTNYNQTNASSIFFNYTYN
jgi:hypothetical protein